MGKKYSRVSNKAWKRLTSINITKKKCKKEYTNHWWPEYGVWVESIMINFLLTSTVPHKIYFTAYQRRINWSPKWKKKSWISAFIFRFRSRRQNHKLDKNRWQNQIDCEFIARNFFSSSTKIFRNEIWIRFDSILDSVLSCSLIQSMMCRSEKYQPKK